MRHLIRTSSLNELTIKEMDGKEIIVQKKNE